MANFIEKEITNFLRRFIYSSVFKYSRKYIDKYNQWTPFFVSLLILGIVNVVIALLCPIVALAGSFPITFIIFVIYWHIRISDLRKIGNTRNSKFWYDRQFWYGLNGWQFEQEVADVFEKNGYKTEVTKGSGDGGVDIIMSKNGLRYIVQCKRYSGHQATPQELRALWGVMDDFKADVAVMVATDGITDMGRAFVANKPNYEVLTLDDIIELSRNQNANQNQNQVNTSYSKRNNNTVKQPILLSVIIVLVIAFAILLTLYLLGIIK